MNIANLIIRLQELADSSTDAFELMVLAKSIEKAKVGAVRTVATFGDLPTLPLSEDGELFLVEADEDIYFNVGTIWEKLFLFNELYAWGYGANGQLGNNTAVNKSSPVTVVGGITNWTAVSGSNYNSLGLTNRGVLYAWGSGTSGQLGDNTIISKSSPVTVVGGITTWSAIAAGRFSSLGLTSTGLIYAWGSNTGGALGDNTAISKSSPVTVVGGITNWSSISSGHGGARLAITNTGILYAWGDGSFGQLGTGTTFNRSSPVTVVGGITNWSAVSTGGFFALGLTNTGIVYAWGYGANGQLGDNSVLQRSSPVTVVGGITNWSAIAAGRDHSLGLRDNGVLYAWGFNTQGELGDNTNVKKSSPVTVVGGITNWSAIAASQHSLGITDTGVLYAWGWGTSGQLGINVGNTSRSSPVTVVGGITNWSAISAGGVHSLAIKAS
jgi:alpha-tubulin suppressor-like RCC1 family protein